MLVLVTCTLIMLLIIGGIAAATSVHKTRYNGSGEYDGPETNLNIRELFDDSWKKR